MTWAGRLVRVGVVLCLALAALLLAADVSEYPSLRAVSLRALARGTVPLVLAGAVNLRALTGGRGWSALAVVGSVALLAVATSLLRRGAPPFFPLLAGTAALLAVGSGGLLAAKVRARGD